MFHARKIDPSRKAEAAKLLRSLDTKKKYRLQKISAKEDRPVSVFIGLAVEGSLLVMPAYGPDADDFVVVINSANVRESLQTSRIQGCGTTDDGVIVIETMNSCYRLEVA